LSGNGGKFPYLIFILDLIYYWDMVINSKLYTDIYKKKRMMVISEDEDDDDDELFTAM
jgi:hypothetical protein